MLETAKAILAKNKIVPSQLPNDVYAVPYLEEIDDNTVVYHIGEYQYRVESINQQNYGVRAVVELMYRGETANKNLLSLYSSRARTEFINKVKGCEPKKIEKHLLNLETELKKHIETKIKKKLITDKKCAPSATDEEKKIAMDFLTSPDIFETIKQDISDLGFVGEDDNKLLCYLIASSRKLSSPLSGIVKAQSSSGKSMLLKTIVNLMPDEEVLDVSRITEQALFWMNEADIKHKLVVIAEREGNDGNYAIRLLQSEKKLRLLAPQKSNDDNVLETKWIEVNGPIALLESTTQTHIEIDNQTRVLELYVDESENQTKLIQEIQKRSRTLEGMLANNNSEIIKKKHKVAQRLLENVNIVIPFADKIQFPSKFVRNRRDCDRYFNLIEACAYLRQFQKPVNEHPNLGRFVEADLVDYAIAYNLAIKVLGANLDELDKRSRELLNHITEMCNEMAENNDSTEDIIFTRRDVMNYLKTKKDIQIYPQTLQNYITPLESEFLEIINTNNRKTFSYRLNLSLDENGNIQNPTQIVGLTSPDELKAKITPKKPRKA